MRIVLTPGALPRLEGAADFKRFSVAVDPILMDDLATATAAIGDMADEAHVWVRPDALRALSPLAGDAGWRTGLETMIGLAAKHGWTNARGEIRAHVEPLAAHPPVEVGAFRDAMRRFASGVCIVAAGQGAARCGMTVSAFTSVSAEPPMILVCLNRSAASHDCVTGAGTFSVNILSASQEEQAMLFAGQRGRHGADRFDADWLDLSGAPVLRTAHHALVCTAEAQHASGSHTVLIGRVIAARSGEDDGALLNYNGALRQGTWAA
ncbi:flavin reductase family protein [Mesobacterium pallidum]|uniref:flavin reductase family protein n=1 Tax=Mesobacterium pallidum TaxID=2872037 RepID=UPI001EE20DB7|nr:flavin reductase family protein [Mesobacterium pallidum]